MTTQTISSYVTSAIGLGPGPQTVIITNTGSLEPSSPNLACIFDGYGMQTPTVINSGVIFGRNFGSSNGYGVFFEDPGTVTNNAGALIDGGYVGVVLNFGGSLNNQGVVIGQTNDGVDALAADVTNGSSGNTAALIRGANYGIYAADVRAGYATNLITNFGTIYGGTVGVFLNGDTLDNHGTVLNGVSLAGSYEVLNIYAGSTITGVADVRAGVTGVLNLEKAPGSAFGVLTGLNNGHYDGFSRVNVGAGAHWQLNGVNIITPQTVITNNSHYGFGVLRVGHGSTYGVLEGSGLVLGSIQDNGEIAATGGTLTIDGNVTGTGELFIALNSELLLEGKVTFGTGGEGNHEITFEETNGGTETLGLVRTGVLGTPIANFGAGDQFDVAKGAFDVYFQTSTNLLTINQGSRTFTQLHVLGSFTTANFGITPDGHGGSDIFYKTA